MHHAASQEERPSKEHVLFCTSRCSEGPQTLSSQCPQLSQIHPSHWSNMIRMAEFVLVWLVARSYSSLRIAGHDGRKRASRIAMQCEFERCQDALADTNEPDLQALLHHRSYAAAHVDVWVNHVVAAVLLRHSLLCTSELDILSGEQRRLLLFWRLLYRNPGAMPKLWYVDVVRSWPLKDPARFTVAANKYACTRCFFLMGELSVTRMLNQETCGGGRVGDCLLEWSLQNDTPLPACPKLCANVFVFHACLLAHGHLRCYCWPCGKKSGEELVLHVWPRMATPQLELHQWVRRQVQDEPLTASLCQDVCDALRTWRLHIPREDQALLEHYLARLQAFVHNQQCPQLALANQPKLRVMEHFVEALLLSLHLRAQSYLSDVVVRSVRVACSSAVADIIRDHVAVATRRLPSRTALSRAKHVVHVGWLMHMQHVTDKIYEQKGVFRIQMCDSSPQGGRDWLNSQFLSFTPAQLAEVFLSAHKLIHFELLHDMDDEDIDQDHAELYEKLQRLTRVRVGAPVCLGSGRTDASHKLSAQIHSIRLASSSWKQATNIMNSIGAWVTDFGVESVLSRMPRFNVRDLYPWIANERDHYSAVEIEGGR